jgi:hypothetical protein
MSIDHLTPDCTGRWEPERSRKRSPWRCRVCTAEHPDTPLTRIAAVRENLMGTLLRLLAADGHALLFRDAE